MLFRCQIELIESKLSNLLLDNIILIKITITVVGIIKEEKHLKVDILILVQKIIPIQNMTSNIFELSYYIYLLSKLW